MLPSIKGHAKPKIRREGLPAVMFLTIVKVKMPAQTTHKAGVQTIKTTNQTFVTANILYFLNFLINFEKFLVSGRREIFEGIFVKFIECTVAAGGAFSEQRTGGASAESTGTGRGCQRLRS